MGPGLSGSKSKWSEEGTYLMDPAQLKPIVLKLEYASEPPAGLDTPRSPSRTSHSGGLGKGLGVCISNKFPRDTAAAAGLGNDCPEETGFGFSSKPPIVPVMLEDRMAFFFVPAQQFFPPLNLHYKAIF